MDAYYKPYWVLDTNKNYEKLTDSNELEHYGVLGMKWGVRKDPDKAYSKAGAKLAKLDKKVDKLSAKGAKKEQKALTKQAKSSSAIFFKKSRAKRAAKATKKALAQYQKSQRVQLSTL